MKRDTPIGALVRACARLVEAFASLVEALADRLRPRPQVRTVAPPSVRPAALPLERPRLTVVPPSPPEEDPLVLVLRKLGFSPAEIRSGLASAPEGSGELPKRVKCALAALRRSA